MKLTAWIGTCLIVALLAFLLGGRTQRMSAMEARAKIAALGDVPDLQFVKTKQFEGTWVLGGRIENKLRGLLRINMRETPCVLEDHDFQYPSGMFSVQLLDPKGGPPEISVYWAPEESTKIGRLLRNRFPEANFLWPSPKNNQEAEQDVHGNTH